MECNGDPTVLMDGLKPDPYNAQEELQSFAPDVKSEPGPSHEHQGEQSDAESEGDFALMHEPQVIIECGEEAPQPSVDVWVKQETGDSSEDDQDGQGLGKREDTGQGLSGENNPSDSEQIRNIRVGRYPAHKCAECTFKSTNKATVIRHKTVHSPEYARNSRKKLHNCPDCPYATNTTARLGRHSLFHKEERPFKCIYCAFATARFGDLKYHTAAEHSENKSFKCDRCSFTTGLAVMLRKHAYHHRRRDSTKLRCGECDFVTNYDMKLKEHVAAEHDRSFKCNLCSFECDQSGKLTEHMASCHGAKPRKRGGRHTCTVCDYTTNRSELIRTHMYIHTGEKRFACDDCDYRTADRSNFAKHRRHVHSRERPFHCEFCPMRCAERAKLRLHMQRIHPERLTEATLTEANSTKGTLKEAEAGVSTNLAPG